MLKEFKEFAMKGNVMDIAIGLIMGVAFKAIVTSLVEDVIMPPIGKLLGGVDFKDLFINLGETPYTVLAEAEKAGAPIIKYGAFINTVVDFLIIAFVIFMVIKVMNKLSKAPAPVDPTEKECPYCLSMVSIQATKCSHCTSELPKAAS